MAFTFLAEGSYRGPVVEWDQVPVGKNETPALSLVLNLREYEDPDTGEWRETEKPVRRSVNLWLTPKVVDRTLATLGHYGFEVGSLDDLYQDAEGAPALKGTVINVAVTHEEYEGKQREKIEVERRLRASGPDVREAIRAQIGRAFGEAVRRRREKQQAEAAPF